MAGGKLQLLIRGNQDMNLIGNPQITFFRQIYRKHTNFAIDSVQQSLSGEPKFGKTYKIKIEPVGELLCGLHCHVKLPMLYNDTTTDTHYYNSGIGYNLFKELILDIGDQTIEKQDGEIMNMIDSYNNDIGNNSSEKEVQQMLDTDNKYVQKRAESANLSGLIVAKSSTNDATGSSFMTKFKFWFCRHAGLALPMIAIPNVPVTLTLRNDILKNLTPAGSYIIPIADETTLTPDQCKDFKEQGWVEKDGKFYQATYSYYDNFKFFAEYVFLDNEEKRRFAQNNHKYLIEQFQQQTTNIVYTKENGNNGKWDETLEKTENSNYPDLNCPYLFNQMKIRLDFLNPVKYISWKFSHLEDLVNDYVNNECYKNISTEPYQFVKAQLFMENVERTPNLPAKFFANAFQRKYFNTETFKNYRYVYSFALFPNDHQPSGTCNFSKLSNVSLVLNDILTSKTTNDFSTVCLNLYACSYNILTIQSSNCYLEYPI